MSPERIQGAMEKDFISQSKADLWSVGVILYLLISGRPPFEAETNDELIDKISRSEFMFNGREWD